MNMAMSITAESEPMEPARSNQKGLAGTSPYSRRNPSVALSLVSFPGFGFTAPAGAVSSKDKQGMNAVGSGIPVSRSAGSLTRIVSSGDPVRRHRVVRVQPCLSTHHTAITVSTSLLAGSESGKDRRTGSASIKIMLATARKESVS